MDPATKLAGIEIMTTVVTDRRCLLLLFIAIAVCVTIAVTSFNLGALAVSSSSSTYIPSSLGSLFPFLPTNAASNLSNPTFVESKLGAAASRNSLLPRLAYLISGSRGDMDRLWRTLRAVYHPHNLYLVHLDLESPAEERTELARRIENDVTFSAVRNVRMITKANMVTYRGPTMVSNTLHACAILLKWSKDWDWFINLSASDYPLVTQDDLLYAFSSLPRNLNFIEHTSRLGWKEEQRAKPLIVDPGLYRSEKADIFWATQTRQLPTAFKLFTGSAWMALTRDFIEYTVWGWDNLPRTLLMYYANFLSSPEGYFQTIICNTPAFAVTAVNHDLHFISWDVPPKQHPHLLTVNDTDRILTSNAPFARKFAKDDPVLDNIDRDLLSRRREGFTLGGWCAGTPPCSQVGNQGKLVPGPGMLRVSKLMDKIVRSEWLQINQCK